MARSAFSCRGERRLGCCARGRCCGRRSRPGNKSRSRCCAGEMLIFPRSVSVRIPRFMHLQQVRTSIGPEGPESTHSGGSGAAAAAFPLRGNSDRTAARTRRHLLTFGGSRREVWRLAHGRWENGTSAFIGTHLWLKFLASLRSWCTKEVVDGRPPAFAWRRLRLSLGRP